MSRSRTPEQRLFPFSVAAGGLALAGLAGLFVVALLRGPNQLYVAAAGAAVLVMAAAIAVSVLRRRRQKYWPGTRRPR